MTLDLTRLPQPAIAFATRGDMLRLVSEKLVERKTVEDFYSSTYLGDMAPAFELAARKGVTQLNLVGEEQYIIKRPVEIPNSSMRILGDGKKVTEIRLVGANDYHFVVGSPSAVSYNFVMDNVLFTKEQSSSKGAVLKLQNVYKWAITHSRIYGENKIWRFLEMFSASSGITDDIDIDNILERAVYMLGGTAPAGTVNGWIVDVILNNIYVIGALQAPTDPLNDAVIYADDCFQAVWACNGKIASHNGYAYAFKGTLANRGINTLNFLYNPNVEASKPLSAVALFDAVNACQIGGPVGWSSGKANTANGMAAIRMTPNCQASIIADIQVGLAGGADGVLDQGIQNTTRDMQFVGYDSPSAQQSRGVVLSGSSSIVRGIKGAQILNTVAAGADQTNAGNHVSGITGVSLAGRVVAGFDGPGNSRLGDIFSQDSSGFVTANSPTMTVPDGQDDLFVGVPSAITLWRLEGGPRGRIITLMPTGPGLSVADRFASSPPAGITPNVQLASRDAWTAPIRDDAIRGTLTLKQIGNLWKEIART